MLKLNKRGLNQKTVYVSSGMVTMDHPLADLNELISSLHLCCFLRVLRDDVKKN
jgi:hypothetical protein